MEKKEPRLASYDKLGLPAGVPRALDSPLFYFHKKPKFTLVPDLCRLLTVSHLALKYTQAYTAPKKLSVLDVACGQGEVFSIMKAQRICKGARIRYKGLDVDPRRIREAKKFNSKIDVKLGMLQDVRKIYRGETFDVVVSTETLEHVKKKDGAKFIKDMLKLTKKGGHVILTSANPSIHFRTESHVYEWQPDELKAFVSKLSNAKIVDWFYMKGNIMQLTRKYKKLGKNKDRLPGDLIRSMSPMYAAKGSATCFVAKKL